MSDYQKVKNDRQLLFHLIIFDENPPKTYIYTGVLKITKIGEKYIDIITI